MRFWRFGQFGFEVPVRGPGRMRRPYPHRDNSPRDFSVHNSAVAYGWVEELCSSCQATSADERASACVGCRECEDRCPQCTRIVEWLPRVQAALGERVRP